MRAGESAADSVVGAGAGIGVLQHVGRSGVTSDECAESDAGSAIYATTELRMEHGGKAGILEKAWNSAFEAGARMRSDGKMFSESGGFETRSVSRINRKSRPNS